MFFIQLVVLNKPLSIIHVDDQKRERIMCVFKRKTERKTLFINCLISNCHTIIKELFRTSCSKQTKANEICFFFAITLFSARVCCSLFVVVLLMSIHKTHIEFLSVLIHLMYCLLSASKLKCIIKSDWEWLGERVLCFVKR